MFMQDDGSITSAATRNPQVGFIGWSPDYDHTKEAGDITWARSSRREVSVARPTFDELVPRYVPPPAANDNYFKLRVIGIMGYGGSGKSEVAKYLAGIGFTRTHIKDPLRATVATLLRQAGVPEDMIDRYLDGDLKREIIPQFKRSGTELQQFVGTEMGREFCYPDLWLDIWKRRVAFFLADPYARVTQESVRFSNEADAIRELGGVIVRVERPGVGPLSDHPSERPPCEPDFTIYNNGTIGHLHAQVATWLRHAA